MNDDRHLHDHEAPCSTRRDREHELGPDIDLIEREGLKILRISRSSWHRRIIHEFVLGPRRLEFAGVASAE